MRHQRGRRLGRRFLCRSRDVNPHIGENRWRSRSVVAESVSLRHRGNTSALKLDETEIVVWGPNHRWTQLPQLFQLIWLMFRLKRSCFVITHQGIRTDPVILFDIFIKNSSCLVNETPLGKLGQSGICVSVGRINRANAIQWEFVHSDWKTRCMTDVTIRG